MTIKHLKNQDMFTLTLLISILVRDFSDSIMSKWAARESMTPLSATPTSSSCRDSVTAEILCSRSSSWAWAASCSGFLIRAVNEMSGNLHN